MLTAEVIRDFAETLPTFATAVGVGKAPSVARDMARCKERELHTRIRVATKAMRGASRGLMTIFLASENLAQRVRTAVPVDIWDAEDKGVDHLESAESFLANVAEKLQDVRETLLAKGGTATFGEEFFVELDRLCRLNSQVIASTQEIRWAILITAGLSEPIGDRVFTSGDEWLQAALED